MRHASLRVPQTQGHKPDFGSAGHFENAEAHSVSGTSGFQLNDPVCRRSFPDVVATLLSCKLLLSFRKPRPGLVSSWNAGNYPEAAGGLASRNETTAIKSGSAARSGTRAWHASTIPGVPAIRIVRRDRCPCTRCSKGDGRSPSADATANVAAAMTGSKAIRESAAGQGRRWL